MNSNRMRNVGLLAAPLAALALLSGCGSDETGTAESSPAPASTTTASAPTTQTGTASPSTTHTDHTQTTTSTAPNPEGCAIGELNVTLGESSGAAGSVELPVVFTNTGSRTCTLDGFPGVSYVTGASGSEVGAAAGRSGSGSLVSLAPGSAATSLGASYERRELPGRSVRRDRRCGTEGLPAQQLRLGLPRLPHQGLLDDRREHQPADGRAGRPLNHGLRRRRPQSAGRRNRPERIRTSAASVN